MKQIITKSIQIIFLSLVVVLFTGCLKNDDLLTDGVRTGGLVEPTASIPYKLGSTPTCDIDITIPRGAAITSIKVYKTFYHVSEEEYSDTLLLSTIAIDGANASAELNETLSVTWAQLIADFTLPSGYVIPTDELLSDIGDYFTLSYVCTMKSDNKEIINLATTTVGIANFFAGSYHVSGYFYHPSSPRDINEDKDLLATSPSTCKTTYADFGDPTIILYITIDQATNAVTLVGDGYAATPGTDLDPTHTDSYNPTTGVIELWYYYVGGTGNRIIHETYTPL